MEMDDITETNDVGILKNLNSYHETLERAKKPAPGELRKSLKDYIRAGGSFCTSGETLDIREFIRSNTARKTASVTKKKVKMTDEAKGRRPQSFAGKVSVRDFSSTLYRAPSLQLQYDVIEGIDYYDLKTYHYDRIRGERLRTILKRDRKLNSRMEAVREIIQVKKEKENAAAAIVMNETKKPLQKWSLSANQDKESLIRGMSRGSRFGSFSKFMSFVGDSIAKESMAIVFKPLQRTDSAIEFSAETPVSFTKRFEPEYDVLDIKLFKVRLQETETIDLYEYQSIIASVDSELGTAYKLQHERAAARSLEDAPETHDQSTQIMTPSRMDRSLQIPELHLVNAETNVSYSEILDAVAKVAVRKLEKPVPLSDDSSSAHDEDEGDDPKGKLSLLTSPEFQMTYDCILRTIDSLHFKQEQLAFRDKMLIDPLATSAEFSYEIQGLWTFKSEKLLMKNLRVVALCWNPINSNVLAVGYAGNDTDVGYVCVWNVKHISKYDRSFKFKSRVTYIEFSTEYPSLLAVAFESGGIAVLNISWKRLFVVNSKPGHIFSSSLPVWQFSWMKSESGEEMPITCGENGYMYSLRKDVTFAHSQLLVLSHKRVDLKGIRQRKRSMADSLKTERPGITCMARHPTDPVSYLAGTTDGCVHVCSTNFRNQHLDAYVAHMGPVRGIKFHPHLEHLYLTFGDDHFVRVWIYGIFEPVFEFSSRPEFVSSAVWSPANAEILISLSGAFLDVWDMRRDLARPVRTWENPKGLENTRVIFDKGGNNVTVGDIDGNVIVSGLKCMPFSHLIPREAAARAVEKVLLSLGETDMLQKLKDFGPPFGNDEQFEENEGEEEVDVEINSNQYLSHSTPVHKSL